MSYDDWEQRYRQAVSLLAVSSVHVADPEIRARVDQFLLDQYALEHAHSEIVEVRETLLSLPRRELLDRFGGRGIRRLDLAQHDKDSMAHYLIETFGVDYCRRWMSEPRPLSPSERFQQRQPGRTVEGTQSP